MDKSGCGSSSDLAEALVPSVMSQSASFQNCVFLSQTEPNEEVKDLLNYSFIQFSIRPLRATSAAVSWLCCLCTVIVLCNKPLRFCPYNRAVFSKEGGVRVCECASVCVAKASGRQLRLSGWRWCCQLDFTGKAHSNATRVKQSKQALYFIAHWGAYVAAVWMRNH